jgi:hypothetical protein
VLIFSDVRHYPTVHTVSNKHGESTKRQDRAIRLAVLGIIFHHIVNVLPAHAHPGHFGLNASEKNNKAFRYLCAGKKSLWEYAITVLRRGLRKLVLGL